MSPFRIAPALLWTGLALIAASWPAQAQIVQEAELKAAFIYNFALFTDWPADALEPGGRFYFCVSAQGPLRDALARLAEQPVHGRTVALLDVAPDAATRPRCQVQVLDGAPPPAAGYGLLTVAVGEAGAGAVINLLVEGEHLRFDVDAAAARRAHLDLSSKLLRLAREVR